MKPLKRTYIFLLLSAIFFVNCESLVHRKIEEKKEPFPENVFLESIDRGNPDPADDRTIYYKIYLNKEVAAKTTSGLFFQRKKLSLNLPRGRYLFFAERWYLEESSEEEVPEYKRANNVWQMKPVYIDIPGTPEFFKMTFGIDHDKKVFYSEIEGAANPDEEAGSEINPEGDIETNP
jgi:hypothetical protein